MIKPKMILVEGGTFMMGHEEGYDYEKPVHPVTLSSFYIGQFTVTQKEWEAVMSSNPSEKKGDDLPVIGVSWNDVQEFITKLNNQTGKQYRLPTESEWEYAARGGNQSKGFKYAGSNIADEVAWCDDNFNIGPRPVGQKKPNELGIYDMSGNVYEWCQDRYGYYPTIEQTNPKGPSLGAYRVIRGGAWFDFPRHCHVAIRYNNTPGGGGKNQGFRLAHDFETFKNQ